MTTSHYAVFTAKKQTGSGGGLSAHIDRQRWDESLQRMVPYEPESVKDPSRTRLNHEYIMAPGMNRTEAIEQRIKEAGITRKIKDDAVKAICIICSSDHDKMKAIEQAGQLDQWAKDCIRYIQGEFGEKNVVAAALHMDEKSPHLHVTVVPIVQGQAKERKERPKLDKNGNPIPTKPKKKIKKQQVTARLCAKEIMTQSAMTRWQTDFAKVMEKYGMVRGIECSPNKHQEPKEYNARESLKEEALGIFGQDKRSKKFRQGMADLNEEHKAETDGLKLTIAKQSKQIKALQAQIDTDRDNYQAQVKKARENERNMAKGQLYKYEKIIQSTAKELDQVTEEKESLKKQLERWKTALFSAIPQAEKAIQAIRTMCSPERINDLNKREKEVVRNAVGFAREADDRANIAKALFHLARPNQTQIVTPQKLMAVHDSLIDIAKEPPRTMLSIDGLPIVQGQDRAMKLKK